MSTDNDFWDEAFNDDTFGDLKPYKQLGEDEPTALPILLDGDIVAYRAAAPCDGRGYAIVEKDDHSNLLAEARYKKEIMKIWDEFGADPDINEIIPTKNPEPESYALYNIDKIIQPIIEKYPGSWVRVYLTGNTNFRSQIDDNYKGNRKSMERPVHLSACKQYLLNRYKGIMKELYEADDLMGIEARRLLNAGRAFLIATIDKDLNCVPGGHYNFVKDHEYQVSEEEALFFFYAQCLTGDATDNIPGIKGIGPKKSEKILSGCESEIEYYTAVLRQWAKYLEEEKPKEVVAQLNRSAEMLWILQEEGVMWNPPIDPGVAALAITEERENV